MAAEWWVVPQGTIGNVISDLSAIAHGSLTVGSLVHVVQSPTPPSGFIDGPYPTQAAAEAAASRLNGAVTSAASNANPANTTPQQAIAGAIPGVTDIGDFFHRLSEGETWTRVAEVALGGIILYAALRGMTGGAQAARSAPAKPVKAVAKVAAPEVRYGAKIAAKRVAPKTTARAAAHRNTVRASNARPKTTRVSHVYHHKAKP